jgi:hypothetical protein
MLSFPTLEFIFDGVALFGAGYALWAGVAMIRHYWRPNRSSLLWACAFFALAFDQILEWTQITMLCVVPVAGFLGLLAHVARGGFRAAIVGRISEV